MSAKIGARQLSRLAVAYVRQSSPGQVLGNRESQARQHLAGATKKRGNLEPI